MQLNEICETKAQSESVSDVSQDAPSSAGRRINAFFPSISRIRIESHRDDNSSPSSVMSSRHQFSDVPLAPPSAPRTIRASSTANGSKRSRELAHGANSNRVRVPRELMKR